MLPGASHTGRHTSKRGKSLDSEITGRGLTMAGLNINSLLAHIDELKVFVSNQKLDNLNFQIREDLNMEELECLTLQISNAHSGPFLVSTWYRPPPPPVSAGYI